MQGSSSRKSMRRRTWFLLFGVLMVCFCLLIGKLGHIMLVEGQELEGMALKQRVSSTVLPARRGSILDRNNKVLAQSNTVWNVCISPADIAVVSETNPEIFPTVAKKLAQVLELDEETILEAAKTTQEQNPENLSYYAKIKSRVESHTVKELEDWVAETYPKENILGRWVYFEEDTKRYYIYDNLASTVIGFTNYENQGAYGLESYYDKVLSGSPGISVSARTTAGSNLPYDGSRIYPATDGYSLVLTLDETVQSIVEKHLEMAVVEHNIKNNAVGIVMNIKTGEILALAAKPDFNPNTPYDLASTWRTENELSLLEQDTEEYKELYQQLQFEQWRNKAVSDSYEPGSVYKLITASTGLEDHLTYTDDVYVCHGSIEVADRTYNCHNLVGHGTQTLTKAIQNSCNPAFITLGLRIGGDRMYDSMTNFGLGQMTGVDLPGEVSGILHSQATLSRDSQVELASTSMGQSIKTTPIQMITAAGAVVNGGYLMQPYVVKQVLDSQGNVIETTQPLVKRQVISEETSAIMRDLVESVVTDGSGKHAAVPGYRIGGKTGTSEKLEDEQKREEGEDIKKEYVLSFMGFAPMDDPTYAVLVALDAPDEENPWGSVIAAPVAGAIFQEILPYLGVEPQYSAEELARSEVAVPSLIGMKPHEAQAELTIAGLKTKIEGQGNAVVRQVPQAGQKIQKGGTVTLYTEEGALESGLQIPELVGMTSEQAAITLTGLGLNVEYRGDLRTDVIRIVEQQWPLAGESATTGDVVIVTLIEKPAESAQSLPDLSSLPADFGVADDDPEESSQTPSSSVDSSPPPEDDPPPDDDDEDVPDTDPVQDDIFVNPG